jgi:hypothetical protein
MLTSRSFLGMAAAAGVALTLAVGAAPAQARDVYWSVGVNSPGVTVGASNGYPMYSAPPVYVAPAPVYYAPPPPRPVYYAPPAPVYYAPPPPVVYRGYGHRHHHHHGHGDRWYR